MKKNEYATCCVPMKSRLHIPTCMCFDKVRKSMKIWYHLCKDSSVPELNGQVAGSGSHQEEKSIFGMWFELEGDCGLLWTNVLVSIEFCITLAVKSEPSAGLQVHQRVP